MAETGDFTPDVAAQAGDATQALADAKAALAAADIKASQSSSRGLFTSYAPSPNYDPIEVTFSCLEGEGILVVDGVLAELGGEPPEELRVALNYLNRELPALCFYLARGSKGPEVRVRQDLLPAADVPPRFDPRELTQTLTSLCMHRAVLEDSIRAVQRGRPWKAVSDALRSLR